MDNSNLAEGVGLEGGVETIEPGLCRGWLHVRASLSPPTIAAYDGAGRRLGTCRCRLAEKRERFLFEIRFDAPAYLIQGLSILSLRLEGDGRNILGGPFVFGPRDVLIAAARQIAGLALKEATPLDLPLRGVLQATAARAIAAYRQGGPHQWFAQAMPSQPSHTEQDSAAISVIVPIFADVALTQACLSAVMTELGAQDRLVLIADAPPEVEMISLLERFQADPRVTLLHNPLNLGFVASVNRGLAYCDDTTDVLLLNADACLHPGGLDELRRVLHAETDIATVTAMSNNATIFSYPHPDLAGPGPADLPMAELAAVALRLNRGLAIDVPTGHGFCLLIRRAVLTRLGGLDPAFGRGYGEENAYCARASDLGLRHVAAAGVLVTHHDGASFGAGKAALVQANLALLHSMFPEHTATVMAFERADPLRVARWPIDAHRLAQTRSAGTRFCLVVQNELDGGTQKAIAELAAASGQADRPTLRLIAAPGGMVILQADQPALRAVFAPDETEALLAVLGEACIDHVVIHQLLGFGEAMIRAVAGLSVGRSSIVHIHDYYPLCPRTTLIDAADRYCGVADVAVCSRCLEMGGAHAASHLATLGPAQHRALFADLLATATAIVAPSHDTAEHLHRVWPGLAVETISHPTPLASLPRAMRPGSRTHIVLLGALGPHKGSATLLALARRALLTHVHLTFVVIGHTDIDAALLQLENVRITGRYHPDQLPSLLADEGSAIALFLHGWPETFSYTLSEAVQHGLFPIVPDLGAPAERVRAAGFGVVVPHPIDPRRVLDVLDSLAAAELPGSPRGFATSGVEMRLAGLCARPVTKPRGSRRTRAPEVAG